MAQNKKKRVKQKDLSNRFSDTSLWMVFIGVSFLAYFTRLFNVSQPDHICWDETHFGKMGSWYINRTFFFDVHPPLGKMLIALSGYLTGYDGTFPFEKPGDKYEDINYVGMRVFCTIMGASVIPFAFMTVWEMTHSLSAATFSAIFIITDNGVLTLSRYILLDPLLLCFMMAAVYGNVKFNSCCHKSFSFAWWFWLLFTGTMIACCISVKFVGLFTILLIGLRTVFELWDILGDLSKPFSYTVKHFIARFIGLVVLPIVLYIAIFYVHLIVLKKSGTGDGFYSSGFQAKLEGNSLYNASMPKDVAYGATISLKNFRTGGGYLHSHWHLYPEGVGARQQQVTTYTHKDENNYWIIKSYTEEKAENDNVTKKDELIKLLKSGDIIRLEHVSTHRNLHSHREPAPLTKKHYQVTGYGENGVGDANDIWKVVIVNGREGDVVNTVRSQLKFVHYLQHCVLTTTGKQLPKWAYEQQEVTCNPNLRDKSALWNVEDNFFSKLPNVSFQTYAPSFFERFIESHAVMIQGNAGLKPKEGEITSRPWHWPIDYKGQFFSGNDYKIYLLGNPVIWWSNLAFLGLFVMAYAYNSVKAQRGYIEPPEVTATKSRILKCCGWLFIGWLLHYVPFWAMGRVLYFHHYFPALLFSSMLTGVMITYILESVNHICNKQWASIIRHTVSGFVYSSAIYSFYLFSPLSYGMSGPPATEPNSTMYGLKWIESWEF